MRTSVLSYERIPLRAAFLLFIPRKKRKRILIEQHSRFVFMHHRRKQISAMEAVDEKASEEEERLM